MPPGPNASAVRASEVPPLGTRLTDVPVLRSNRVEAVDGVGRRRVERGGQEADGVALKGQATLAGQGARGQADVGGRQDVGVGRINLSDDVAVGVEGVELVVGVGQAEAGERRGKRPDERAGAGRGVNGDELVAEVGHPRRPAASAVGPVPASKARMVAGSQRVSIVMVSFVLIEGVGVAKREELGPGDEGFTGATGWLRS